MDFGVFFETASGNSPYPYQEHLAELPLVESFALRVPTGCGKTLAVLLAWLWQRRYRPADGPRPNIPRRLVYCLPMRVLVEQTHLVAGTILKRLTIEREVGLHVLMGGEVNRDWTLHPEQDAILIGTQDMLLSRSLNRGYASGRSRWPQEFGLLNSDCLWIMDEIQLMGSGLATTIQLDSFRQSLGTYQGCPTIWMSATFERQWLATVDHADLPGEATLVELTESDLLLPSLKKKLEANKFLHNLPARTVSDERALAAQILNAHEAVLASESRPALTLVVLNTVKRAMKIYNALKRPCSNKAIPTLLLHSRFRPPDRERLIEWLNTAQSILKGKSGGDSNFSTKVSQNGVIVISTQVVEAGVDLTSRNLFSDLCPWTSFVQRLGRCNRNGDFKRADVYWLDLHIEKASAPYIPEDLKKTRELLTKANGSSMSPANLPRPAIHFQHKTVIRSKDLIELFDTTPDLAGNDIDISRFLRDEEDLDVAVLWRARQSDEEPSPAPRREELCPVPIKDLRDFSKRMSKKGSATFSRWDFVDGSWKPVGNSAITPGQVFLLDSTAGGYDPELGWTGKENQVVQSLDPDAGAREQDSHEKDLFTKYVTWETIAAHTDRVVQEIERLVQDMKFLPRKPLRAAARWHDRGKAHPVFQKALAGDKHPPGEWAKAPSLRRYARRHFRHELASALALLQAPEVVISGSLKPLVAFLVAAHHGKVRLSIRSFPGETRPPNGEEFARGIWEGDLLPPTFLGGGLRAPEVALSLRPLRLGDLLSWVAMSLRLRDNPDLGVFRLAYLEAILRAADQRVSASSSDTEDGVG